MTKTAHHFQTAWTSFQAQSAAAHRSRDELDFLPAHLAIIERPPARGVRLFAVSVMALCGIALLWAVVGRVDMVAPAPGRLIVSQYSKIIQAPEDGVITRIAVRNGQKVQAGETLLELNPTAVLAERDKLAEQIAISTLEVARLRALLTDNPAATFKPPAAIAELDAPKWAARVAATRLHLLSAQSQMAARDESFIARLRQNATQQASLRAVLKDIDAQLANVGQRLEARQALVSTGNFPRMQLLELDRERIESQRLRTEKDTTLAVLAAEALSTRRDWERETATNRQDFHDRLKDEERKLSDARQDFRKMEDRARLMMLVSPVDGVVQQLSVHTVGGVTKIADNLMVVVPENAILDAEVTLQSKDVGFVTEGQSVEIKVDSFPYTRYGTIRGTVITVSRDSARDEKLGLIYPTRIQLDQRAIETENGPVLLSAGMSIAAEIKTGDRRVIDYLLSPLQEYASEALKER